MTNDDVTIEILKDIRDEARASNGRLESLESEVHALRMDTNERFESLERRQTETEVRLSTELVAVAGAVNEVTDLLRDNLSTTLKDHERRITSLESQSAP